MVRLVLHDYNEIIVLEIDDERRISCWTFENGRLLSKEVSDDSLTILTSYNNLRVDSVIVSPTKTIIHLSKKQEG